VWILTAASGKRLAGVAAPGLDAEPAMLRALDNLGADGWIVGFHALGNANPAPFPARREVA
jgi:hypothetical protein